MTTKSKPRITDEMAIKGFRYLVDCAGFDFEYDSFNPDHIGKAIWQKGFDTGYAEAKRILEKKLIQGDVSACRTDADSHPGVTAGSE